MKSQQVRLMAKVYESAALVIAWLGHGTEEHRQGLLFLQRIRHMLQEYGQSFSEDERSRTRYDNLRNLNYARLKSLNLPDVSSSVWDGLLAILNKPWFSRVWIIQEYLFAKSFIFACGGDAADADVIFLPIWVLGQSQFFLTEIVPLTKVQNASNVMRAKTMKGLKLLRKKYRTDFLDLLALFCVFEASDPRDIIFALATLNSDINPGLIDYSLDLDNVLIRAACEIVKLGEYPLDMLSYSRTFGWRESVPSWVPNWDSQDRHFLGLANPGFKGVRRTTRADIIPVAVTERPEINATNVSLEHGFSDERLTRMFRLYWFMLGVMNRSTRVQSKVESWLS